MVKVTMPDLGESTAEGTIGRWLKKPGDRIAKGEPLVEVITDKVSAEVPSPVSGVLTEILAGEGATVLTNAVVAVIDELDEGTSEAPPLVTAGAVAAATRPGDGPDSTARPAPAPALSGPDELGADDSNPAASALRPSSVRPTAVEGPPATVEGPPATEASASMPGGIDSRMTPAVRRLLREHGLSPAQITGTGIGGRINSEDVLKFLGVQPQRQVAGPKETPPGPQFPATSVVASASTLSAPSVPATKIMFTDRADDVLVAPTKMRSGIAAQMTRALAVPHAYVHVEVDATNLVRLRASLRHAYQAREGISLSFVPFVVKAAAEGLRRHPHLNANWTDQGLVAKRRINMGVAVAVDGGLIAPVIRDVDQLSVTGINRAIADVSARARANRLRVDDFGGGTFTVDNTGWFGSILTMPIINVPEVAILTMEAIVKRPAVVETADGDAIAIRWIMNMVMAIDHRATDGAQAGHFLREVKAWLEGVGTETAIS